MHVVHALLTLSLPGNLVWMPIGVVIGIVVGAIPGLTDPMALGLAIPFTFGMATLPSLLLLLGVHFGAVYGGSITAILLNTPGTPAGAAAALDGYPLTQKGMARKALQMSATAALVGALISYICLVLFAPLLSQVALIFGPAEYFALGVLGLSVVSAVAGDSLWKALFSALTGLFLSLVGTNPMTGEQRFTLGIPYLQSGFDLIVVLIGLFAVAEVLRVLSSTERQLRVSKVTKLGPGLAWKELRRSWLTMIRGGGIGAFIGALPGTGAVIASFLSYNATLTVSKKPEVYGKGELNGVAAAESGSVATEAAALIPLLTFGIPGDIGSAIILGAMILHGVPVGPQLFSHAANLVSSLFTGILIMEVLVFVTAWFGSPLVGRVVKVPFHYLYPSILVLVVGGTFALANTMFNVWVAAGFGLLGFVFLKFRYPIPPLLLGLILGPIVESNFLLAMSSTGGDFLQVIARPITAVLLAVSVALLAFSVRMNRLVNTRRRVTG